MVQRPRRQRGKGNLSVSLSSATLGSVCLDKQFLSLGLSLPIRKMGDLYCPRRCFFQLESVVVLGRFLSLGAIGIWVGGRFVVGSSAHCRWLAAAPARPQVNA